MSTSSTTDQPGELRPLVLEDLPRPKIAPDGHALEKITQQVYMAVERALVTNKINTVVLNAHVAYRSGRLADFVCLANPESHGVVIRTVPFIDYTDPWQRHSVRAAMGLQKSKFLMDLQQGHHVDSVVRNTARSHPESREVTSSTRAKSWSPPPAAPPSSSSEPLQPAQLATSRTSTLCRPTSPRSIAHRSSNHASTLFRTTRICSRTTTSSLQGPFVPRSHFSSLVPTR